MYEVDGRDRVTKLVGAPQSSVGAPNPLVVSDGLTVVLAYYLQDTPSGWDGSTARMVGHTTDGEPVALVRFDICLAHQLGPPNDEAFTGHPLASRGLAPYGSFEIEASSWIRGLEKMNRVHPSDRPGSYAAFRHLVFTFHDQTFECVCRSFAVTLAEGSISGLLPTMTKLFRWGTG
jgi:hypothetical protein